MALQRLSPRDDARPIYISFAVAPAYRDVPSILSVDGQAIYELNAVGVEDVRYSKGKQGELLEIGELARNDIAPTTARTQD